MTASERAELEKNETAGWKLVSYSATRYTFFLGEDGNPAMIREEEAEPNKTEVIVTRSSVGGSLRCPTRSEGK